MTLPKSNGVLTTRNRSGQVKPSNSMPSDRRTALRAPSAPTSHRPRRSSTAVPPPRPPRPLGPAQPPPAALLDRGAAAALDRHRHVVLCLSDAPHPAAELDD